MATGSLNVGVPKRITATANINATSGMLLGVFVAAASATPTITIYNSATTTTTDTIVGVFTPVPSTWYTIPVAYAAGLYVVISGTVDATFITA